jgi:large subunit ribosomal protein L4
MLEVQVYNTEGEKVDTLEVDEGLFGSTVNAALLKQAIVAYHANKRQGTAAGKSRSMVRGSTKKLFRQKGTGNARRGSSRTNLLRGGGAAFAKRPRSFRQRLPRKMRKAALNSAILAKMIGQDLMVLQGLQIDAPKTAEMARIISNLNIDRSCLLALAGRDRNVVLSSRNIPDLTVRITDELNAFDVASRRKMVVTTDAMQVLMGSEAGK